MDLYTLYAEGQKQDYAAQLKDFRSDVQKSTEIVQKARESIDSLSHCASALEFKSECSLASRELVPIQTPQATKIVAAPQFTPTRRIEQDIQNLRELPPESNGSGLENPALKHLHGALVELQSDLITFTMHCKTHLRQQSSWQKGSSQRLCTQLERPNM